MSHIIYTQSVFNVTTCYTCAAGNMLHPGRRDSCSSLASAVCYKFLRCSFHCHFHHGCIEPVHRSMERRSMHYLKAKEYSDGSLFQAIFLRVVQTSNSPVRDGGSSHTNIISIILIH